MVRLVLVHYQTDSVVVFFLFIILFIFRVEYFLCCSWLPVGCGSSIVPNMVGLLLLHEKVSAINYNVTVMSLSLSVLQ